MLMFDEDFVVALITTIHGTRGNHHITRHHYLQKKKKSIMTD